MTSILLIDDEYEMRKLYIEMLSDKCKSIFEATNGREGMDIIKRNSVDIVITDMIMPQQDGLNTILEIRHIYPHVKIIAVSGMEEALSKAKFFGANVTLAKPIDPYTLIEAIEKVSL